jgi:hypothetical protein
VKSRVAEEREIYSGEDRDRIVSFLELNKHERFLVPALRRMLKAYDKMNADRARAVVAFKKLNGTYGGGS